jgi:hypothetical protein
VNDQRCQTKQNIKIQEYIPDGSPFNDHFPEFSDKSVDSSYCPLVRDLKKKQFIPGVTRSRRRTQKEGSIEENKMKFYRYIVEVHKRVKIYLSPGPFQHSQYKEEEEERWWMDLSYTVLHHFNQANKDIQILVIKYELALARIFKDSNENIRFQILAPCKK